MSDRFNEDVFIDDLAILIEKHHLPLALMFVRDGQDLHTYAYGADGRYTAEAEAIREIVMLAVNVNRDVIEAVGKKAAREEAERD